MASFFSSIANKATDGINNEISNVTGGGAPDMSQSSSGGDPSSSDPRDMMKGAHEAQQSLHDFNKARHEAESGQGQKMSKKAKIGRFFKSAFGFEEAAKKAEEAGQDLTGKSLNPLWCFVRMYTHSHLEGARKLVTMRTLLTHVRCASPRAFKQIGGQRWGQTLRLLSPSPVLTVAKDVKSFTSESKPQSSPSFISQSPVEPDDIDDIEPRLSLAFTCTVADCGTRSSHTFTRRSYEKGIVIVQCPGCRNRHLIADHLGWFKENTEDGKLRTIEDLLRARGERVKRGQLKTEGVVEYVES